MRDSARTATLCPRVTREFLDSMLESADTAGQSFRVLETRVESIRSAGNRIPIDPARTSRAFELNLNPLESTVNLVNLVMLGIRFGSISAGIPSNIPASRIRGCREFTTNSIQT